MNITNSPDIMAVIKCVLQVFFDVISPHFTYHKSNQPTVLKGGTKQVTEAVQTDEKNKHDELAMLMMGVQVGRLRKHQFGRVDQLEDRYLGMVEAPSSNLGTSTFTNI